MIFSEKSSEPHSKHHLLYTVRHKISDMIQEPKQISQETVWKLVQYLMLCILLYLCAQLPKVSAQKIDQETAAQQETMQSQASGLNSTVGQSMTTDQTSLSNKSAETGQDTSDNQKDSTASNSTDGQNDSSDQSESSSAAGVIVIDAGHGGDDPGMIGSSGINEKVLNLVYAKKLQALLEAQGYQVVMTRETEDGLYDAGTSNMKAQDMQRRVAVIAEAAPLLTVSIHQNSYPDESVSGPQVFYFEHSAEGEKLAACIQDAMNEELQIARPRVQKGNTSYYILKRSQSVTVIVECGFLSCPEEEAKLQDEAYQDQAVQAICDGILAYLEN